MGDSAAVFCHSGRDPKTESVKLTVDHRISDPGEKQRLAAMGIELGKNKTRLYGLNLSRCLGDHFIKAADLGFTAVPSVSEVLRLGPSDSGLVVIASDGLWDVAEPGRVMQVGLHFLKCRPACRRCLAGKEAEGLQKPPETCLHELLLAHDWLCCNGGETLFLCAGRFQCSRPA